jgi:hypothetical protein
MFNKTHHALPRYNLSAFFSSLLEDGMTSVTWADNLDLDQWLKEFSLDELWRTGRIGARA